MPGVLCIIDGQDVMPGHPGGLTGVSYRPGVIEAVGASLDLTVWPGLFSAPAGIGRADLWRDGQYVGRVLIANDDRAHLGFALLTGDFLVATGQGMLATPDGPREVYFGILPMPLPVVVAGYDGEEEDGEEDEGDTEDW